MIVVSNKLGGIFIPVVDASAPGAPSKAADEVPSYRVEDLFADPEVCRRVGSIISKAAERRRPQSLPAPRSGRSSGSTD
jgi:hypothetical protein